MVLLVPVLVTSGYGATSGFGLATVASAAPLPVPSVARPARLLAGALAAAKVQVGVDYTSTVKEGTDSDRTVVTAGSTEGTSTIALKEGNLTGRLSVVYTGTTAYVRGDQHGLQSVDFTVKAAGAQTGHWVKVPSRTGSKVVEAVFEELASTLTVPSIVTGIAMTASSLTGRRTVDGHAVIGIMGDSSAATGSSPTKETLYVRASGKPLPVEAVIGGSPSVSVVFTGWGKRPAVHAPGRTVTIKASWLSKSS